MAKHTVKVLNWANGYFQTLQWISGTRWNIKFFAYALLVSANTQYIEYDWNYLEQHPEEMGFEATSIRIPNGTHLHPVDAYSCDGVLVPIDRTYLCDERVRPRGVWVDSTGVKNIGLGPGEHYSYTGSDGWSYICTMSRPFDSTQTGMWGASRASFVTRDPNGFTTYEHFLFARQSASSSPYAQRLTGVKAYTSAQAWNIACQSGDVTDLLVGATASWDGPFNTGYPTSVLDVPIPSSIGSFDDLISAAADPGWDQLARDAYNNIEAGFDGNGIALSADLVNLTSSAKDTLKACRNLTGNKKFQAAASVYLSFRYGWKLLMSDVKSLSSSMKRNIASRFTRCTATQHTTLSGITTECTYQVYYDKYGGILGEMSSLDQMTQDLDLEMSLGNLWDLVKYSFVLDWFADVGSVLESVDSFYNLAYRYDVLAAGKSTKVYRTRTVSGYTGSLTETAYRRRYSKDAIPPSPLPATHQPRSQSWIDGAALVVQRV